MITALYIRVSTQEQAREGYSIGEQEERLRMFAAAHKWKSVNVYSDPGFSGSNLNRPGMQALIRDVEHGLVSRVVVYKLDRLSRSQKDTLHLIEDVFKGVAFISMTENFDTSTPFGMAMIGILSVFAQLERQQIRERMALGREARAKVGLFHGGGSIPPGYDYIDGRLVVNEYEAEQVRKAFDLAASGSSYNAITKAMASYHVKGGTWTRSTVYNVLSNRLYIGVISWDGQEYPGQHVPLVDADTFAAAQNKRSPSSPRPYQRQSLLGGLIFCGQCGARYHGRTKPRPRKDGTRRIVRKYMCYSKSKTMPSMVRAACCNNKVWDMDELDDLILGEIRQLALDPDAMAAEPKKKNPAPLRERIAEIDKQIDRLLDLYQTAEIDAGRLSERVRALQDEKNAVAADLAEIENDAGNVHAVNLLHTFGDVLDDADPDAVKAIVHGLIDRIVLDGDDITIYWAFE